MFNKSLEPYNLNKHDSKDELNTGSVGRQAKIAILVIFAKFPTRKAYGVTTQGTLNALASIGWKAYSMSFPPDFFIEPGDQKWDQINFKEGRFSKYLRLFAYRGFSLPHRISWKIVKSYAASKNSQIIHSLMPDAIWLRDSIPNFLFNSNFNNIKIILELHELANKREIRKIKRLPTSRIVIAPISELILDNLRKYKLNEYRIILSPMGIDLDEFREINGETLEIPKRGTRPIKIGYFGSLMPGGYSKGYEDLLALGRYHQDLNMNTIIYFIGVTILEKDMLEKQIIEEKLSVNRFRIETQMPHMDAINLMQQCDVLVLTKSRTEKYFGSPLKAVEYAATGIPIIAAISDPNKAVFSGNFQPFWYESGNTVQMNAAFIEALQNQNEDRYKSSSFEFARQRTWKNRTNTLISEILSDQVG